MLLVRERAKGKWVGGLRGEQVNGSRLITGPMISLDRSKFILFNLFLLFCILRI